MSDALITRLSTDLRPVPPRALEGRLALALAAGLVLSALAVYGLIHLVMDRPFAVTAESPMVWTKLLYALAFGLLGLAAVPVLSRPDGRIRWPLALAAMLVLVTLVAGGVAWMGSGWDISMLMGATALACPWLIALSSLPLLLTLLAAMRRLAPRSPALAGFAAGLLAGGFGATLYALFCAETGLMFMAVWYSLGIVLTAGLGTVLGHRLLRW